MKHQRPKHGRTSKTTSNLATAKTKTKRGAKHQESQCTVCRSAHRLKIERDYLDGCSERALALIHDMSHSAIHRHAVGTELNRLRQTDTEIYYLRVLSAAERQVTRGVTIRDGLRAAERLDKIRGVNNEARKSKQDAEQRQARLDERVAFALEGFTRIGLGAGIDAPKITRRDIIEMMAKTPESAGDLYPLIMNELSALD